MGTGISQEITVNLIVVVTCETEAKVPLVVESLP
jgi:hypothetical protein